MFENKNIWELFGMGIGLSLVFYLSHLIKEWKEKRIKEGKKPDILLIFSELISKLKKTRKMP